MSHRMLIAAGSLVSGLVALYLHLWKIGKAGVLPCTGAGGCAYVQLSPWGYFLGVDVALIGTVGYTLLFLTALVGSQPRFEAARWPTTLMHLMIWPAVCFTVRLKYGEFVVLKSFCPWCAVSAVTIALCALLVTLDGRRLRRLDTG
jgi:uncharacterized membrane protein